MLGSLFAGILLAQTPIFTDIGANLTGVSDGHLAWGDYDLDGDLDLLVSGASDPGPATMLYRNTGQGFTNSGVVLPGVSSGTATWHDYDGDGDLDILISGEELSKIYINADGQFTDANAGLRGLSSSSADWGDYDNDGDLDLFLAGLEGSTPTALLYRQQDGEFEEVTTGLPGFHSGGLEWGDYDTDGDLDLLIAGFSDVGAISRIYRNEGDTLIDIHGGLTGIFNGGINWGDFDSDGDLDVLLAGHDGLNLVAKIYRNDNGSFTPLSESLTGISNGTATWVDYDSDGDLDACLSGSDWSNLIFRFYSNSLSDFMAVGAGNIPGIFNSHVAWGDYDNDGDLDAAILGNVGDSRICKIFRNDLMGTNTPPEPPQNPLADVTIEQVMLSWEPASDAEIPDSALTYNLRIGYVPGGVDMKTPTADLETGQMLIPDAGNVGARTSWIFLPPDTGTYYWSVQAVDPGYEASSFTEEQSFRYLGPDIYPPPPPPGAYAFPGDEEATLFWSPMKTPDLSYYVVYASTDSGFGPSDQDSIGVVIPPDTQFVVLNLINGIEYFFSVTAVDTAGNMSSNSAEAHAIPVLPNPLLVDSPPADSSLSWGCTNLVFRFNQPLEIPAPLDDALELSMAEDATPSYSLVYSRQDFTVIVDFHETLVSTDTLDITFLADNLPGVSGWLVDGNANGISEGSPADDIHLTYRVAPYADFDLSGTIDFTDLSSFTTGWYARDTTMELGPASGEVPTLHLTPDGAFNVRDLISFIRMWNWFSAFAQPGPALSNSLSGGAVSLSTSASGLLMLRLPSSSDYAAVHVSIHYTAGIMLPGTGTEAYDAGSPITLRRSWPEQGIAELSVAALPGQGLPLEICLGRLENSHGTRETTVSLQLVTRDGNTISGNVPDMSIEPLPPTPTLHEAFPNPFNPATTLRYDLPKGATVHLMVYDLQGRTIADLVDDYVESGYHEIKWDGRAADGRSLPSGIYIARLTAPGYSKCIKMVLLK
jgi:hypothetical protein